MIPVTCYFKDIYRGTIIPFVTIVGAHLMWMFDLKLFFLFFVGGVAKSHWGSQWVSNLQYLFPTGSPFEAFTEIRSEAVFRQGRTLIHQEHVNIPRWFPVSIISF